MTLQPSPGEYRLVCELKGHTGTIFSILSSNDNEYLASGDAEGTLLWDLTNNNLLRRIPTHGVRGGTTAIVWVRREGASDGLVYGTGKGYLVFWTKTDTTFEEICCIRMSYPSEVTAITYDSATNRLAAANRKGVVALFLIDPTTMRITDDKWAWRLENTIPKSVAFNSRRDVLVFGMHDAIYTLDGGTGSLQSELSRYHGIRVGHAVYDLSKDLCCVDNAFTGCTLYRMSDGTQIKEFRVPRRMPKTRPKQVALAESCKFVISASDHGAIYVFNHDGELLQKLPTGSESRIHALTVATINGTESIIAGEAAGPERESSIFLFKKLQAPLQPLTEPLTEGRSHITENLHHACEMVLAAVGLYFIVSSLVGESYRWLSLTAERLRWFSLAGAEWLRLGVTTLLVVLVNTIV